MALQPDHEIESRVVRPGDLPADAQGGALGGAAQGYIKSNAALESAKDIQARQNVRHAELMRALAGTHTVAGAEGPTSTTYSADKVVEKGNRGNVEYTETRPIPVGATQAPGDYSTAIPPNTPPVTTSPVSSPSPVGGAPLTQYTPPRNFHPFFQALLA